MPARRHILINGELVDVYHATISRGGWTNLLIGTDGVPWGSHNVPTTWWHNRQAPGIKTGGHMYRHAEVNRGK